jgi:putative addiction module CopG family antidote
MMPIQLTEDLERFVDGAVRSGRYASRDDVIRDALIRLKLAVPEAAETGGQAADPGQEAKTLTKQEFQRHLVKIGLIDEAPGAGPASGPSNEDLVDNQGEIISEVVIRERLIEWLIGFL